MTTRWIFVFGSNTSGRHGKGAALTAMKHGAIYGQAEGIQGNSYAIPTRRPVGRLWINLPLETIAKSVALFLQFARDNPDLAFNITPIGCGLAGYKREQIRPMFSGMPGNCFFSKTWNDPDDN